MINVILNISRRRLGSILRVQSDIVRKSSG